MQRFQSLEQIEQFLKNLNDSEQYQKVQESKFKPNKVPQNYQHYETPQTSYPTLKFQQPTLYFQTPQVSQPSQQTLKFQQPYVSVSEPSQVFQKPQVSQPSQVFQIPPESKPLFLQTPMISTEEKEKSKGKERILELLQLEVISIHKQLEILKETTSNIQQIIKYL